jgi:hypothetical protein
MILSVTAISDIKTAPLTDPSARGGKGEDHMVKKNVGPRIKEQTAEFYKAHFLTTNAGAQYVLEAFPSLYRATLAREIKGELKREELSLIIDTFNTPLLSPGFAGQHLASECADAIQLDYLDKKWTVDSKTFLAKIEKLTISQKAIVEIWAKAFWKQDEVSLEDWISVLL